MNSILFERYLTLLGISEKAPSSDALYELVQSHLFKVPIENITKLYY